MLGLCLGGVMFLTLPPPQRDRESWHTLLAYMGLTYIEVFKFGTWAIMGVATWHDCTWLG